MREWWEDLGRDNQTAIIVSSIFAAVIPITTGLIALCVYFSH